MLIIIYFPNKNDYLIICCDIFRTYTDKTRNLAHYPFNHGYFEKERKENLFYPSQFSLPFLFTPTIFAYFFFSNPSLGVYSRSRGELENLGSGSGLRGLKILAPAPAPAPGFPKS